MRFRALMFLFVLALIFAVFLAGIWKSNLHDVLEHDAEHWSGDHLETLATELAPLLSQNQMAAVSETMDAVLAHTDAWKSLQLLDNDGGQLYPTQPLPQDVISNHIRITNDITYRDEVIGTIVLNADPTNFESHILNVSYVFMVLALLGFFLIMIATAFIFEAFVLKPLKGLSQAADAVTLGDYAHKLPESEDATIGQLIANFSTMRTAIEQHATGLYEAKEAAEEASKAKSVFVASISHELRTPLNGMLGMANLLENSTLNDTQRQQVAMVTHSGNTLLGLLDEILEMTRIEANNLTLKIADFDLNTLLQDMSDQWAPKARAKGLTFVIDDRKISHHMLSGDIGHLSQLINILIGNSLKFTLRGEIRLRITQAKDADKDVITGFEINDTGIGIAAEYLPSLFEKFTQADSREARRYQGSGLGLSLAKGLAEQMGGKVGVTSVPDEGSTFWLSMRLPLATKTDHVPRPISFFEEFSDPQPKNLETRPLQILVAEDNIINQKVICGMLERSGHEIATVENGVQAVEAVSTGNFDLVLMDINMPEMTGLEATRHIRALQDERSKIPIIAVTANTAKADRDKYLREGMTGYVPKPIEAKKLAEAIEAAIGQAIQVDPVAGFEEVCVFEATPELEADLDALFQSIDAATPASGDEPPEAMPDLSANASN